MVNLALKPVKMALISDDLLRHTEVDVRLTVASCITEIIRITAPDAPYSEEQMKDYFLLVNTAFKELPSISGRSYSKVVSILQTLSRCQICVLMLDYQLHDMVHEMFGLFLNGIRPSHSESVSSSMEHVMNVIIQNNVDSDESPVELTKILLVSLKKENKNVSPLAFQLAKKVFEKCSDALKDYLPVAVRCMEVPVEEYDDVVVSSFRDSTQREDMDAANEMGVYASSRGETELAGNGGFLSKLVENDADHLKDEENFRENCGVSSRIAHLINNQESVPARDGDCPDVNGLSVEDGTKTPTNNGSNDETRSEAQKDENVKPWYSCNRVKNQKSVDRLSSSKLTDVSCSREMDSSNTRDSSLLLVKEDTQIKDHDIVVQGKSSEQHISDDACIHPQSENVGNPNRVERELGKHDVPVSRKRNRKPRTIINPDEGYDPLWMVTKGVPTKDSNSRKINHKNSHYEDRIMASKASQSLLSHVGEQLNAPVSEKNVFFELNTSEKFLKETKDVRVDQDNGLFLLSTSVSDAGEIITSKDDNVAENTKEKMDKSWTTDFLHGVSNEVLQNSVTRKRSSTGVIPANESWRKNIVLETGNSNDLADVHTLKEKRRTASDKLRANSANKIYEVPKRYGQTSSNNEVHARKFKGKSVSDDLAGDFLIKILISQSRNKSSKRAAQSPEFSNHQPQRRVILPEEEIKEMELVLTETAPGETSTGKTVISKYQTSDAIVKNHSKKRKHAPAKKTQKGTSQGKAVITDNQPEDSIIKASKVNPANKFYGKQLVGCKIKVWWPMDKMYYEGKIVSYDCSKKTHQVDYDDGDIEILDLSRERWEMI
ncbi:hypothetical protein F511_02218 [Dorcoceras hygrometricum]|uniref:Uncharacterized protein n=1 Tax=Dorcoceras hygrometricum TaxID=472368 RepID=A0A2Z7AVF3_9LAMI|nr:hypothetical protein F511_02218 [Dorcoceras hygrometricum]